MYTTISVRLSPELAERLDRIARETERSKSFVVQKALESYLEEFADLHVALDRFHNPSDSIVKGTNLRESLGI
jgi:RHH-type rel operon transcriptional repressor/antitoxin RelB